MVFSSSNDAEILVSLKLVGSLLLALLGRFDSGQVFLDEEEQICQEWSVSAQ